MKCFSNISSDFIMSVYYTYYHILDSIRPDMLPIYILYGSPRFLYTYFVIVKFYAIFSFKAPSDIFSMVPLTKSFLSRFLANFGKFIFRYLEFRADIIWTFFGKYGFSPRKFPLSFEKNLEFMENFA